MKSRVCGWMLGSLVAGWGAWAACEMPAHDVPRELRIDLGEGVTLELLLVKPGEFLMGSPATEEKRRNDEAQHLVRITRPYYLGKYEVTQEQWVRIAGRNPSEEVAPQKPVHCVSWSDAREWLSNLQVRAGGLLPSGMVFRLPSEAEWEYACRAGTTSAFSFGEAAMAGEYAWHYHNSSQQIHQVGLKQPNPWGFHDMHGNIAEWCLDVLTPYQFAPGETVTDPLGPVVNDAAVASGAEQAHIVLRGGNWARTLQHLRSARRLSTSGWLRNEFIGFRAAAGPPLETKADSGDGTPPAKP